MPTPCVVFSPRLPLRPSSGRFSRRARGQPCPPAGNSHLAPIHSGGLSSAGETLDDRRGVGRNSVFLLALAAGSYSHWLRQMKRARRLNSTGPRSIVTITSSPLDLAQGEIIAIARVSRRAATPRALVRGAVSQLLTGVFQERTMVEAKG